MSQHRNGKKRCMVKKLNFEECVLSHARGKSRKKVRLRATLSREMEKSDGEEDFYRKCEKVQKWSSGSPVLSSKFSRSIRRADNSETPDFSPEKKIEKPLTPPVPTSKSENSAKSKTISPVISTPKFRTYSRKEDLNAGLMTSPVLSEKFGRSMTKTSVHAKKKLIMPDSPNLTGVKRKRQRSQGLTPDPFSQEEEIYLIESSTSEEPRKISSLEIDSGESQSSIFTSGRNLKEISIKTPEKDQTRIVDSQVLDSGKKRKRFKKNSLCARLENLNKRQVSERRILEHEKKIMKIERKGKISLMVLSLWRDSMRFILKCLPLSEAETETRQNNFNENVILIVDGDLVKEVCQVKENSLISVAPPWQQISLSKLNITVLLSIVSLEIGNQSKLPLNFKIIKVLATDDDDGGSQLKDSFLIDCLFSL